MGQLYDLTKQLNFDSFATAFTLQLYVRVMNTRGSECVNYPELRLAIAVVHLAAKYLFRTLSLQTIISRALGVKSSLVNTQDIIEAENHILNDQQFKLEFLSVFDFISLYASVAQLDQFHIHVVKYSAMQLLLNKESYCVKPSYLAAACISFALQHQNKVPWNQSMCYWTGKTIHDFKE